MRGGDAAEGVEGVLADAGAAPHGAAVASGAAAAWGEAFFHLDAVDAFRDADPAVRVETLRACSRALLVEAQGIEKLGLSFCAKMCLLSETTEERMAYSLMGADEALHFAMVTKHLGGDDSGLGSDPFLALLQEAIEEGSKNVLTLLIQVVLEGWGLTHYRHMAEACRDALLTGTLSAILRDEAFHHGTATCSGRAPEGEDERFAVEFLARLRDGPGGPQGVVSNLSRPSGPVAAAARGGLHPARHRARDCRGSRSSRGFPERTRSTA